MKDCFSLWCAGGETVPNFKSVKNLWWLVRSESGDLDVCVIFPTVIKIAAHAPPITGRLYSRHAPFDFPTQKEIETLACSDITKSIKSPERTNTSRSPALQQQISSHPLTPVSTIYISHAQSCRALVSREPWPSPVESSRRQND